MIQPNYLGIDIGGTSAKYALITQNGRIIEKKSFPTGPFCTQDMFLNQLTRVVQKAEAAGIRGVGICSLGFIDSKQGVIWGGVENLPFLKGLRLVQYIKERWPDLTVSLCNDAQATALGEHWKGCAQTYQSFACIVLGTGVGGAIALNGKIWEGAHFRAGEVEYLDFQREDGFNLGKDLSALAVTARASTLLNMPVDGFAFFSLASQGDSICVALLDQWINQLARMAAALIIILDVECIVFGGGVSAEREMILPKLREYTNRYLPCEMRGQTAIEVAQCANEANLLGAVAHMRGLYEDNNEKR